MNENKKTMIFVGIAGLAVLIAISSRPAKPFQQPDKKIGEDIIETKFDPLDAAKLDIADYDAKSGKLISFSVEQSEFKGKKRWSIPSHDNYPADAKDQMVQAATALMGLKILGVASSTIGDQELYGVVDPNPDKIEPGMSGIGKKVTLRKDDGTELVSLIIGNKVKTPEKMSADQKDQYYVRKPGQNAIYVVSMTVDNLSTDFHRWIEKNLLQFNAWDMKNLDIRDYTVDLEKGRLYFDGETKLDYQDQGQPPWKFVAGRRMKKQGEWVDMPMTEQEELNLVKLDGLKQALQDLQIVDVAPKPEGLSADLKKTGNLQKFEQELLDRGFLFGDIGSGEELLSSQGEFRVGMKDGVQYVLRFGDNTIYTGSASNDKDEKKDKKDEPKQGPGVGRYLFVLAEFDPNAIEKPQLEPLPESASTEEKKSETSTDNDAAKPADEKADEKKSDEAKSDEKAAEKAAEAKAVDAERARIEKENKKKQDAYEEKVKAAQKRVEDLNNRFADWYYIISDDVYRKIHLTRADIVKKKGTDKDGKDTEGPLGDLKKLESQGPLGK